MTFEAVDCTDCKEELTTGDNTVGAEEPSDSCLNIPKRVVKIVISSKGNLMNEPVDVCLPKRENRLKKGVVKEEQSSVNVAKAENFNVIQSGKRCKINRSKIFSRKDSEKKQTDFTCRFCHKVYPSEGGWRYHVHTIHSQSFQPFICDLCGKLFKAKKNLEGHKNSIHFHLKQHLCDLCGRGFASKYALKVHKIWHSGERNFSCEICGNKFRTRSKLNSHRAVHGGPKNFICEVCSRDFRRKKDFETHLRSHTGEKPYSCLVCGKAFSSLTNKKKHEKNHTHGPSGSTPKLQSVDISLKSDINNLALSYCLDQG